MPYIGPEERDKLARGVKKPETPGQLNFVITGIVRDYLRRDFQWDGIESYGAYNEVIGVLECAKLELYRRKVSDYEDRKKDANGDVY